VSERVRAFVALPLPGEARERVVQSSSPLRESFAGLRWSAASTFHVTLRFLGDASRESLDRLRKPLARAAALCPPALAALSQLGMFPERGAPRVLWLAVEPGPEVALLQQACEAAACGAGFAAEPKPFRPHLTLGRWRGRAGRPALPALDLGCALLDRLVLFESELRSSGARHAELDSWPLGGVAR
jgi:2'-5' RNA ligase